MAEYRAADPLSAGAAAGAKSGRLAPRLRRRATCRADVSHRRARQSVLLLLARAGSTLGNGSAGATDHGDRIVRYSLPDHADLLPRALAMVRRLRPNAGASGHLHARRLVLDRARDLLHQHLCVAD